ncbi:hypothetical protein [Vibrio kanaloae]|uniref:hypothetical protein n=1 Tax=Vibrio kanaloae TaxID=170673 RepID=UPI001FCB0735|nr:hypothetical protein [Vibrio kanaloae]
MNNLIRDNIATMVAVLITVISLGAFFIQFHSGLSNEQSDWGSFGSYIGGVLAPLFAFLAFLAGLENLKFIKNQQISAETLMAIRAYEKDLKSLYEMVVTCDDPWLWVHDMGGEYAGLKELPLSTLLKSDSLDWEYHLSVLKESPKLRRQLQDNEIWLQALNASNGLFRYIDLYQKQGGDQSIIDLSIKFEVRHFLQMRMNILRWCPIPKPFAWARI